MEGQPYQLFINLPFGELMAEQTGTGYQSPYKSNGKLQRSENPDASGELDPETGLYYYGARYYDPQSSTWLSVDPLAEKYAGWTPYNYCVGNPVVFVDPDGMEIVILGDETYQKQVNAILDKISNSGKAGKFLVNKAIKSERTFVIADIPNPEIQCNVFEDNKNNASIIPFSMSNREGTNAKNQGGVKFTAETSLAHELAHFVFPQEGFLLINGKNPIFPIRAVEPNAVEWENMVRKDLEMPARKLYNNVEVYGKGIKESKYKTYFDLVNKKDYGIEPAEVPNYGQPKRNIEASKPYNIGGKFGFVDDVKANRRYHKQQRIKF